MNAEQFELWMAMRQVGAPVVSFCKGLSFWEAWNSCKKADWLLCALDKLGFRDKKTLRSFGYYLADLVRSYVPSRALEALELEQQCAKVPYEVGRIQHLTAVRKIGEVVARQKALEDKPSVTRHASEVIDYVICATEMGTYYPLNLVPCPNKIRRIYRVAGRGKDVGPQMADHLRSLASEENLSLFLPRNDLRVIFPKELLLRVERTLCHPKDAFLQAKMWHDRAERCTFGYSVDEVALSLWDQYGGRWPE